MVGTPRLRRPARVVAGGNFETTVVKGSRCAATALRLVFDPAALRNHWTDRPIVAPIDFPQLIAYDYTKYDKRF